jgi:alkylated DNA repair dioxygenase AlkB
MRQQPAAPPDCSARSMPDSQPDLFGSDAALPEGFRYQPDLVSPDAERALLAELAQLPFKPFDFHGWEGKRRIVSFGWRYDYGKRAVAEAEPLPDYLERLRATAAAFAALPEAELRQVLVTEYAPGAGIGWHRDKPEFGEVIGISLLSATSLRFRLARPGGGWQRRALTVAPRSAYLLQGAARRRWYHSIRPVETLRYSVTFRRYVANAGRGGVPAPL